MSGYIGDSVGSPDYSKPMPPSGSYNVDSSDYGKPMPWIGYYIAAASMVCLLAMIADFISSLLRKKRSYLSMNAVSLTIFTVAIKLSTDLTTPMHSDEAQLAKLATSLFICVVVSKSIPSLGKMSNGQAVTNITALAILIITSVVNLCIQYATRVIKLFRKAHLLLIVVMLFLLTLCVVSAISLASIKDYLEVIHEKQHRRALKDLKPDEPRLSTEKLRDYVTKFSIMAQSSCPQSVLTRSATWSILLEFLSAVTVIFLILGTFLAFSDKDVYPDSKCDYEGSVLWIAITQAVVMLLGIIPKTRKTYTVPKLGDSISWRVTRTISIGNYLIQSLVEMTESQLFVHIHNTHCRKVMEGVKDAFFYFLNVIYRGVIFVAQVIYFFWAWCFRIVSLPIIFCYKLINYCYRLIFGQPKDVDNSLKPYVLHLVGEEKSVDQLLKHCFRTAQSYLDRGRKKPPKRLIALLRKNPSCRFDGVFNFDSARVLPLLHSQQPSNQVLPLLDSQQPPSNCWTLPLVTLTSIAIALPNIERHSINELLLCVSEGLLYVNQIEDCLNDGRDMIYVKKASKIVWKGVDLHRKWLDVDLVALALEKSNPKEILDSLADSAEKKFSKSRESIKLMTEHSASMSSAKEVLTLEHSASIWSTREVATHSMYRISKTLLHDYIDGGSAYEQSKRMFEKLEMTISDIMGACLTNLKWLILKECSQSSIEERKETAFHILDLFGKTEGIVQILEGKEIPQLSHDKLPFIDEWRLSHGGVNELVRRC